MWFKLRVFRNIGMRKLNFQNIDFTPPSGKKSIQKSIRYRPFPCCQIKCAIPFIDKIVIHPLFDSLGCCLSWPKYPILAVQITIFEIWETSAKTKLKFISIRVLI